MSRMVSFHFVVTPAGAASAAMGRDMRIATRSGSLNNRMASPSLMCPLASFRVRRNEGLQRYGHNVIPNGSEGPGRVGRTQNGAMPQLAYHPPARVPHSRSG